MRALESVATEAQRIRSRAQKFSQIRFKSPCGQSNWENGAVAQAYRMDRREFLRHCTMYSRAV
jgi:hypothetical protein